ncbi:MULTISPECIES: circularly permuted type 2 ATP-grasp protein [Micrococcaceae]|uniref:circularly permuted type 2 ATP-grasp protein n=1 Tax=Micrococcaceae TaxID=1268 RepID=UPI00160F46FB|nr:MULTISPECIES: circularly permuted type 2 ATP-grasp protein [Micrococcaceae]MBB5748901.1 putative circularly permuted ATP-grasp superfamily protein [Micrococcus sp. TA1]HRO29172.1 circularly permuted type 2 ATP-grasp protein [Citricoccus sp.]HRO92838.1 circularly permuted type 2 ATP-grasp protein [Citricoccus sp.]
MSDLFAAYAEALERGDAWDEMFAPGFTLRQDYRPVQRALDELSLDDVTARADSMARTFLDRGVTFDYAGEERAWPLDIVPRVIPADDWEVLERGVAQRVRVLEAFLDDVYSTMSVVRDGVVPRSLITTSAHFHRAVHGFRPAGGVRVHVSGIDVVRDAEGTFRVLEDNVRVPSGVSYVLENRRAMSKGLPEAIGSVNVRPVEEYPRRLLAALRTSAPSEIEDPVVVVLTPGVYNSAYFEHTLLAGMMGVELVEGRDLVTRANKVYMRTTDGERRVDVIYKRIDDDFLDPLHFRSDSVLGVPGIVNAARAGNVTIANAVGNGVADDKLVYTYMPDLTRYYLGEDPIVPNVDTFRLEEPEAREEVMDRLDELVVKPVDGSGGKGLVIGPDASPAELEELRRKVLAEPRGWIAQPVLQLSTVPTLAGGRFAPRHVDLRPFAINDGHDVWVLPGGLTRVALKEGSLIVNSSQGGGSKDTWVMARTGAEARPAAHREPEPQVHVVGDDWPEGQSQSPLDEIGLLPEQQQQQGGASC